MGLGRSESWLLPILPVTRTRGGEPLRHWCGSVYALVLSRRTFRQSRPAQARDAGFRADLSVLLVHAMARFVRCEFPACCRLHAVHRQDVALEVATHQFSIRARYVRHL